MADLARGLIKTIIENNWIKNHLQLRSVHLAMWRYLHLSHRSSDLFNLESLRINIRKSVQDCTYFLHISRPSALCIVAIVISVSCACHILLSSVCLSSPSSLPPSSASHGSPNLTCLMCAHFGAKHAAEVPHDQPAGPHTPNNSELALDVLPTLLGTRHAPTHSRHARQMVLRTLWRGY